MGDWLSNLRASLEYAKTRGGIGVGGGGMSIPDGAKAGGKVWYNNGWQDEANIGDPQQVLQNRSEKSPLSENYLNWNSGYNQNMRKWLDRMFGSATGGADSLFAAGLDPTSGVGAAQRATQRARASDSAAQAAWQQFLGGQQLGVQTQLAWDQYTMNLRGQLNQRQMFNDQRRDQALGDILGGVAGLGLNALTGGVSGLADSFTGSEMDSAVEGTVGQYVNADGGLNVPLAVPNGPVDLWTDSARKYNGWTNPVPLGDVGSWNNSTASKKITWGDALDFSDVTGGAVTSRARSGSANLPIPGFSTAERSSTYVAGTNQVPGQQSQAKRSPWRFSFSNPSYGTPGGWRLY